MIRSGQMLTVNHKELNILKHVVERQSESPIGMESSKEVEWNKFYCNWGKLKKENNLFFGCFQKWETSIRQKVFQSIKGVNHAINTPGGEKYG